MDLLHSSGGASSRGGDETNPRSTPRSPAPLQSARATPSGRASSTPLRGNTSVGAAGRATAHDADDHSDASSPLKEDDPASAAAASGVVVGSNTLGLSDAWLLNGINFLIVDRDRPGVFVATFLLMHGWEERHIGAVVFLKAIVGLFVQAPMGDLVDRSVHKRSIGFACNVVVSVTSLALLALHGNRVAVAALLVVQGIALTAVIPVVYSLTLGIVGHGPRMEQQTADNEVYCHLGTALYALAASACAWKGDDAGPFYLVAALAVGACLLIAAVHPEAIDLRASRGLEASPVAEKEKLPHDFESAPHPSPRRTPTAPSGASAKVVPAELNREARPYMDLFADVRVLAFLATMLLFHFANAAMLPLLSQYLALGSSRHGILITGANIALAQIVQALTAGVVGLALQKYSMKAIFLFGLAVLPVRGILITVLLQVPFDATYYLILTQILDGISHGVYSVLCVLVTEHIMHGTGRFSFMLGVGQTCHFVGDAFSNLLGEFLAGHYGYVRAFEVLTACSFIPVALYAFFMPSDHADGIDDTMGPESQNPLVQFKTDQKIVKLVEQDGWWGGPASRGGEIVFPAIYQHKV